MMLSLVSRPSSFKTKERPGVGESKRLPPPAGKTKPSAALMSMPSLWLNEGYTRSPLADRRPHVQTYSDELMTVTFPLREDALQHCHGLRLQRRRIDRDAEARPVRHAHAATAGAQHVGDHVLLQRVARHVELTAERQVGQRAERVRGGRQ